MNRPKFSKLFKTTLTFCLFILLSACGSSGSDNSEAGDASGEAIKGVISNGIVKLYDLNDLDTPLAETRTNNHGQFNFPEALFNLGQMHYVELSVDSATRMTCDLTQGCFEVISASTVDFGESLRLPSYFKLSGFAIKAHDQDTHIHISPLSHVIASTAKAMNGGLTRYSVDLSNAWVKSAFNLGFDPLTTATPDLTTLANELQIDINSLEQGILAAAFYEKSIEVDWSIQGIEIGSIDISDISQKAAAIAQDLSQLSASEPNIHVQQSLNLISTNSQNLANSLSDRELSIQNQPESVTLTENNPLTLSINASGEGELSYQWLKNDIAIFGANASSYHITHADIDDSALYNVIVSDDNSSTNSLYALVTVNPAIPVSITSLSDDQDVTEGNSVDIQVIAEGTTPISYQWYKNGSPIEGSTSNRLSLNDIKMSDAGSYHVSVSNANSELSSDAISINVHAKVTPVSISLAPQSVEHPEGNTITLTVQAAGSGPISYQWQKNGLDIPNQTSSTLTLANTTSSDSGQYRVIVSNSANHVISSNAQVNILKVLQPLVFVSQPSSLDVNEEQPFSLSVNMSGSGPISYQWYKNGSRISGANDSSYSVASSTGLDSGSYQVSVSNDHETVNSVAATVNVLSLLAITRQPESISVTEGEQAKLSVFAEGVGTLSYQWYKNNTAIAGQTNRRLTIAASRPQDSGVYQVRVSNEHKAIRSSSVSISVEAPPEPEPLAITEQPENIVINSGDSLQLNVRVTGDSPYYYQWQKGGSMIPGATSSSFTVASANVEDAGSYRVQISNGNSTVYSEFVSVTVNEEVPSLTISQQPEAVTVTETSSVTFSVDVTGSGFIAYQWRKDGQDIENEHNSTLVLDNVQSADIGSYQVFISNWQGSLLSNSAYLTVLPNAVPLTITQHPSSQSLSSGETLNLVVGLIGDGPINYQWFKDGSEIIGATSNTLTIQPVNAADSGRYSVNASNSAGQVNSNEAVIAVSDRPSVQISWDTPTEREDGSSLSTDDIFGYTVQYGYSEDNLASEITINSATDTEALINELEIGSTLYIRIATIDSLGVRGQFTDTLAIDL